MFSNYAFSSQPLATAGYPYLNVATPVGVSASGAIAQVLYDDSFGPYSVQPYAGNSTQNYPAVFISNAVALLQTGFAVTGAVGSVSVVAKAGVSPTTVSATGATGSVTFNNRSNVYPTGLQAAAYLSIFIEEDTFGPYSCGPFGNNVPYSQLFAANVVQVPITKVSATGAVGSVSVVAKAGVSPTTVSATGATGSVTFNNRSNVYPTGVQGVGNLSVYLEESPFGPYSCGPFGNNSHYNAPVVFVDDAIQILEDGVFATGSTGTVAFNNRANVYPTTVSATGATGSVTFNNRSNVYPTGVQGVSNLSVYLEESPFGPYSCGPFGNNSQYNAPVVFVDDAIQILEDGVFATGSTGTVAFNNRANVYPTGVTGTSRLGTVNAVSRYYVSGLQAVSNLSVYLEESPFGPYACGPYSNNYKYNAPVVFISNAVALLQTGFAVTGATGSVTFNNLANVYPTGVTGTSQLGGVTPDARATVFTTGLQAAAYLSVYLEESPFGPYSCGPFGNNARYVPPIVAKATANTAITKVSATGAVGSVSVVAKVIVLPTTVSATGQVGTVRFNSGYRVTGVYGTVLGINPVNQDVFGPFSQHPFSSGPSNEEQVVAKAGVSPTTVTGTGATGTVAFNNRSNVYPIGVVGTSQLGIVTEKTVNYAPVSTVSATGQVGTVRLNSGYRVTGVSAEVKVNSVIVWGDVNTGPTAVWVPVDDSQTSGWTPVSTLQSSDWTPVDDSQTNTWTPVDDSQTTVWTKIAA